MELIVSHGDAIDKLTILAIKREKVSNEEDRRHVHREHAHVNAKVETHIPFRDRTVDLEEELLQINRKLWELEDMVRVEDLTDYQLARLARMIFRLNEIRAGVKKRINVLTESAIHEVKVRKTQSTNCHLP